MNRGFTRNHEDGVAETLDPIPLLTKPRTIFRVRSRAEPDRKVVTSHHCFRRLALLSHSR